MRQPVRSRPRPPRRPAVRRLWDDALNATPMQREWQMAQGRRRREQGIASYTVLILITFALTISWLNRDALAAFAGYTLAAAPTASPEEGAAVLATISFGRCHIGGGSNCVVDGDTFWLNGEKIRIADIDTPETHPSRCAREAELGERATVRLRELLSAGPVALAPNPGGDSHDRYGRRLAIVERNGASIGMMLVNEGLARPYAGGQRASWC